ncbi:MAG: deoxyhypusine synthase [Candidatus Woesearchaeota archaeon]|jgi:deoxyhypusine synthase|nr:deoxyhypusine synthase [Candidatus Woesearchaeota archaeon]MDP6265255.1 deoxyhypusine synthase [Candidatus Woesearchaeota archaeon]MDP7322337.1 deoxyhypusine synthase [Candidatus Woesearchaeota archaeon]HJO01630.1 deoxyhypusine synthase [Candidatus Woesearchaeota archaeon]|tara:strand:- start:5752 stop:6765 length:1014 start_codon:yes stop_codon:yes gene_type:complete
MSIYNKNKKWKGHLKNYMNMDRFPEIKGYNFDEKFDFKKFIGSYQNMGFQGSNLGMAFNILEKMLEEKKNEKLSIWMSFTGNMISSGNREIIAYLVKNKLIDGITTTAASLEEDVIKCIKPFHLGTFDIKGEFLLDESIGRIGNILAPMDRYLYFERFFNDFFKKLMKEFKGIPCTYEITKEMGEYIKKHTLTKKNYNKSFLYWAAKNKIPVFCPGITDGAMGDLITFFKRKNPKFAIDVTKDNLELTKILQNTNKAGCIALGGGIAKHFLLNSAIFREGFEYSIYITTANEYDGSDSGGNQEEAISWAKIKPNASRVKVVADATLIFPLLVAGTVR